MANISLPKTHRFHAWIASLVFSCVCLAAHASTHQSDRTASENWALSALCIEFILSFFGVVAHFVAKDQFVGQYAEGGLSAIMVLVWCAGLPTIMNPSLNIAVGGFSGSPTVLNANLYFFSWIAFASIVYVHGSYMQEYTGRDLSSEITPKQVKWLGLLAASIVILITASMIHSDISCNNGFNRDNCARNSYAISIGVFGIIFPAAAIGMAHMEKLTIVTELGLSVLMFVFYTVGVGVITFGHGSGTAIGNLYFATWIGFITTVYLTSNCFTEYLESRNNKVATPGKSGVKSAPAPALEELEQAVAGDV